jgi:hypothetical protein
VRNTFAIFALGALFVSAPAWANWSSSFSVTGAAGTFVGGQADFSYDSTSHVLSITLTNLGDVKGTAQALTGVGWNWVGGGATGISAPSIDFNGSGNTYQGYTCPTNHTACSSLKTITPDAWESNGASQGTGATALTSYNNATHTGCASNGCEIDVFTGSSKGSPVVNSTITADGGDGLTSNGNDSPYLDKATFEVTVSGTNLGDITGVSDVLIAFNTAQTGLVATLTPEPGFYGVLALGGAGLFFVRRRRKTA